MQCKAASTGPSEIWGSELVCWPYLGIPGRVIRICRAQWGPTLKKVYEARLCGDLEACNPELLLARRQLQENAWLQPVRRQQRAQA